MIRDTKRSAVYAVEHAVFAETLFSEPLGAAGVLDLSGLVSATAWWGRNGVPFTVGPTRREAQHSWAGHAAGRPARIKFSVHQEDAATLAHELAHLLAARHGSATAHGPIFVAAEIDTVTLICGTIAAGRLARGFSEAGLSGAVRPWEPPAPLSDRGLYGRWRAARFTDGG